MNTTTYQQALARYHAAYDNAAYTDIRRLILMESAAADDEKVADFMNRLIDACLECCGSPRHNGAHIRLAMLALWLQLADASIAATHQYLLTFQQSGNMAADDFEATARGLLRIGTARTPTGAAAAHASNIHSWRGRSAYHLLAGTESLLRAAGLLLEQHEDEAYVREKIQYGLDRIADGLKEAETAVHQLRSSSSKP